MTNSEILKAAHRQAARYVTPGLVTYPQAMSRALREMYAAARANVTATVGRGYAARSMVTLTRAQRAGLGLPTE